MRSDLMSRQLLTEREVAEMLGVSVDGIRKWRRKGMIPFVKIGGSVRFRITDIDILIENGLQRPICSNCSEPY